MEQNTKMCLLDDCKMQDVNTFVRNYVSVVDKNPNGFGFLFCILFFLLILFYAMTYDRFMLSCILAFLSSLGISGIVVGLCFLRESNAKKCIKKRVLDIEDTEDEIKVFRIGKDSYGLYKWSFWSCREVFPPQYEYMTRFASNAIIFKDSGKWGLYNTETKLRVPAEYDSILPLSDLELVARKGTDVVYYNQFCERIVK